MSLIRRGGLAALVLCLSALAGPPAAVRAADEPAAFVDSKAVDALVHKTLREVINEGADMYNAKGKYQNSERDFTGCYRLYQGALMATKPLLSAHPELQKAIDDGLTQAAATPQTEQRAFVLRTVIDKVREAVNPNPTAVAPPPPPSVKEATAAGKAVGAEKGKLTLNVGGEDKSFNVPESAKITIDGKEGKLEDVKKDSAVTVTTKGDVVTKVEVKGSAAPPPPPPPPPAKETKAAGKVTKVEKDKLTLKDDEGKEKSFTVPETAKVTINGKEGKLDDVKADSSVTVTSKDEEVTKVEVKAAAAPPPPPEAKTLWDRLGGEANVAKVVDDFVNTAGKDPKVNFWRDPTKTPSKEEVAALKKGLIDFVSSATGGPLKYEGKSMKDAHKGMKITNEEFDAAAKDLKDALEKNGAKADDVKAVLAAVEGTRKDIVEEKKPDDTPKPPADKDKPAAPADKDKPVEKDKPTAPADKDKPAPADKDKSAAPADKDKPAPADKDKSAAPADKDKPAPPAEAGHVSGKVTYKGKPASGNTIGLLGKDFKYTEEIGADGSYQFKDDIKPGLYAVYIGEHPDKPKAGAVKVPAKYLDPEKSSLTIEVKKGEQVRDLDLQD